eukprot:CAMPEP_0116036406 /NCGR_PEP_ID=MMETSP0321-20121206/21186_1 /TAXON_ID=163516 /ORGANISM="Leptocylindrus danicus var. danicus, Strain B650" /LENGTH=456 /DNA_ID=CAMNT_0003513907 /DNA_START=296 /DNA_END=1667 /DNA_ORIENTATION=-
MSSPSSVKTRDTSSVLSSPCSASPPNTRNPKSCCDENQSDPSKLMETKIDGLNGSVALLSSPSNRSTKPEVQVLPPRRIVRTTVNGTRAKKIKTVSRINGNRMSAKKSSSRASSSTSMMMPVLAAHQARGAGRSKSSTNANNKNGATAAATLSPRPKGSDVQMNKEKVNIKAPSQSREFRANSRVKPSDHRVFYTRTKRATKSFKVTMIDEAFKIFVVDLLCGNPQDLEVVDAIKDETEAHIARVEASGNISASWRKLYTYTKMDLPCSEVTSIGPIMTQIMDDIKAVCGEIFQNPEGCQKLRPRSWKEPHLLKYVNTKDHKHTGIEMHYDGCDITWSLMLSDYATSNDVPNNPNEENINQQLAYRGGGTYMRCLQQTVLLKKGQILVHPGELYHKGVPITQGERLLGVCFMDGFNPGIYDPSVNCQTEVEQTLLNKMSFIHDALEDAYDVEVSAY